MKRVQPWWDTISLLAGGKVPRSVRPEERLRLPQPQAELHDPVRAAANKSRLLYGKFKS